MIRQKIFIHSSELASIINKNPYDYKSGFERILNKLNPDKTVDIDKNKDINNFIKSNKITVNRDLSPIVLKEQIKKEIKVENNRVLTELNTKCDTINLKLNDTKNVKAKESLKSQLNDIKTQIDHTNQSKIQDDTVDSFINTEIGTYREDSVVTMLEEKLKIKLDTTQQFKSIFIMSTEKYDYYLGGKMDGIYRDKYIVEIKNRMNKFFTSVKDYERCQIQSYMYITNYPLAKLVECFNNKLRITDIYRDPEYIQEIKDCLAIFINNIEGADITKYFSLDESGQRNYILRLYLKEIINYYTQGNKDSDSECMFE
jgi:hypothetical protein